MHNIGIFGVYNSGSIGDWAILQGIIEQLQSRSEELNIQVYATAPDILAESLKKYKNVTITTSIPIRKRNLNARARNADLHTPPRKLRFHRGFVFSLAKEVWIISRVRFWYQKLTEMRGSDLLIIGGGNLLMDLYSLMPLHILVFTLLAKIAGVPLMFYAVGAGPIRTIKGQLFLKLAVRLAKRITVRDLESANLLSKKRITNEAIVSADPALTLHVDQRQHNLRAAHKETRPLKIGITVVPYYDPRYWPKPNEELYSLYVQSMADIVNNIIDRLDCQIISFTTNYPADLNTAVDIYSHLKDQSKCTVINRRLCVQELIEIIDGCDLVIGTRLHSLILSYVSLVPFVGIVYQPKVRAFCKSIGFDNLVVDLGPEITVEPAAILDKINYLLNHKEQVLKSMKETLGNLRELSDLSADIAMRLIGQ